MGLMIFTGGEARRRPLQRPPLPRGRPRPAVSLEEPGRREHSRAVCRAAASVAAREAPGAEAVGARARVGSPDHDGRREGRSRIRSACSPAGTIRPGRRRWPSGSWARGASCLWTTTADRAGNDWPIEPSFVLAVREAVRGAARPTRVRQHRHGRRADEARRPLEPAGLQRPVDSSRRRRAAVAAGRPAGRRARRSRPGGRDQCPRHAPAGGVSSRLGRRFPGHAARSVRGQSRSARKRARADRGGRAEVDARAAGGRDRRRRAATAPISSPRPAARSGATWPPCCSSC